MTIRLGNSHTQANCAYQRDTLLPATRQASSDNGKIVLVKAQYAPYRH
jgi:hypothetical protein